MTRGVLWLAPPSTRGTYTPGPSPVRLAVRGFGLINTCCSPRKLHRVAEHAELSVARGLPDAGADDAPVRGLLPAQGHRGGARRGRPRARWSLRAREQGQSAASALGTPASRPLRATAAEWPRFPAAFARAAGIGGRTVRSHSHGTLLTFASWRVAGCPARAVPRTGQRRRPCDGSDVSGELLAVGTGLPSFSRRRPSAGWAARCRGPPRQERVEKPLNERLALERLRTPRGSYR